MKLLKWPVVQVVVLVVLGCAASPALADDRAGEVEKELDNLVLGEGLGVPPEGRKPPRMVIADNITIAPASYDGLLGGWGHHGSGKSAVVGIAGDGKAAWIAMDLTFEELCGMQECMHDPPLALAHGTALFEPGPHGWQPLVWDFARILGAKEEVRARRSPPAPITRMIDPGADDVVHQLEAALADAAALARAVSDRKDVVLYGSALKERFVGGAAVRAQLAKWKLGFKLRDGVFAGLTTGKTVAWIVANVDAARQGDKAATAYRMLSIWEKAGTGWRCVQLSFSIPSQEMVGR